MSITNQSKPTTTLENATKTSSGETWSSIATTWASETKTWLGVGSFMTNNTKQSTSITNVSKPI